MCCLSVICDYICCCFRFKRKDRKLKQKYEKKERLFRHSRKPFDTKTIRTETIKLSQMKIEDLFQLTTLKQNEDPIEYLKKNHFEVHEDLSIGSVGGYGKVYKADQVIGNRKELIACKIIEVPKEGPKRNKMIESIRREIILLRGLRSEKSFYHIIEVIKYFVLEYNKIGTNDRIMKAFIFMEYANGGDLEQELRSNGPFNDSDAKRYFGEIANGVRFLHRSSLAHRDLKLENILLFNKEGVKSCKIGDFGLSHLVYDEKVGYIEDSKGQGTVMYMAPEIIKVKILVKTRQRPTKEHLYEPMPTDCWALGVIAYRLLTKDFPFYIDRTVEVLQIAYNLQINKKVKFPEFIKIDENAKSLIRRCLEPDVKNRLTSDLIISHQWLEGYQSLTSETPVE